MQEFYSTEHQYVETLRMLVEVCDILMLLVGTQFEMLQTTIF